MKTRDRVRDVAVSTRAVPVVIRTIGLTGVTTIFVVVVGVGIAFKLTYEVATIALAVHHTAEVMIRAHRVARGREIEEEEAKAEAEEIA